MLLGRNRARHPLAIWSSGSSEHVHPSVLRIQEGFGGYEYWMAFTPYPRGDDKLENPCIRVSPDGLNWALPPGCSDPLIPPPGIASRHHADPELFYDDGILSLIYMTTDKEDRHTTFNVVATRDGKTWTHPRVIYEGVWGVSPATARWAGQRWVWSIHLDTRKGFTDCAVVVQPMHDDGLLGPAQPCTMPIPGHAAWHVGMTAEAGRLLALVAAIPHGADTSRTSLFLLSSTDGRHFQMVSDHPILRPSLLGWDNRMIYKSCLCPLGNDQWRLYYSAGSWGKRFGIGVIEGSLGTMRPPASIYPMDEKPWLPRLWEDLGGMLRYVARRKCPWLCRLIRLGRIRHLG